MSAPARQALFCYGTLEFPPIMRAVTGRLYPALPAVLEGYRRLTVRGEVFPGVMAQSGAAVEGTLYSVAAADLRLLDAYENAFYRRRLLRVRDAAGRARTAWVYVVPGMYRHRLDAEDWDPARFARRDFARYLRRLQY